MDELDRDVTRPLALPRIGLTERRKALALGTYVLAVVAAVDLGVWGLGVRTPIWAAWILLFVGCAWAMGRLSPRAGSVAGAAAGIGSVVALAWLSWATGAAASPYLHFLVVIPLLSAIAAPGDVREPLQLGVAVVLAGAALLVLGGAPDVDLVLWVTVTSAAVGFAVLAGQREGRRQQRYFQAERERGDMMARLAELERANVEAERWVAKGQLADDLAHDANSPLAALRSSIAYARAEIDGGHPERAVDALKDAAECVEQLRLIIAGLQAHSLPPSGGRRG